MDWNREGMVDRAEEVERFRGLLERGTPQLVLLYGRRRVGKTFLLSRAWGSDVQRRREQPHLVPGRTTAAVPGPRGSAAASWTPEASRCTACTSPSSTTVSRA